MARTGLCSRSDVPERQATWIGRRLLGKADVPPQLWRQVGGRDAELSPPPACADQGDQQPPRAEVLQQFIHPPGERSFNYRLIVLHDLSVPERRRAQVLSVMKSDVSQADGRVHTRRQQVTSVWLKNAGKAGKTTVQTVIGCIEWRREIPHTPKTPVRQRGACTEKNESYVASCSSCCG